MALAKSLERKSHLVPGKFNISELFFEVPKDYSKPAAGTLRIFARSVKRAEKPANVDTEKEKKQLPWMLYLQGGPGHECRSPQNYAFVNPILDKGYQMLFLDQRGTGLSTPISAATLALQGKPEEQADYLRLFRADSIVHDCEAIRKVLTDDYPEEKKKWSIMGQSFGGFCVVTYLSKFPEGLKEAFTLGGLPPLVRSPDPVYRKTYQKVIKRNEVYYRKYPEDVERVKIILSYLGQEPRSLPSGGMLTPRRFLQMGLGFGFHGCIDDVHEVVLRAHTNLTDFKLLTRSTLTTIDNFLKFDDHVLYWLLHEPCYCQRASSEWSAERVGKTFSQFDLNAEENPPYFTGEMVYSWQSEDYAELASLRETADIVSTISDWPDLYSSEQLAQNTVPLYSATYIEDMYVDYDFAMQTAAKIKGCKTFVTNVMYHNAITGKAAEVMGELMKLRDDVLD